MKLLFTRRRSVRVSCPSWGGGGVTHNGKTFLLLKILTCIQCPSYPTSMKTEGSLTDSANQDSSTQMQSFPAPYSLFKEGVWRHERNVSVWRLSYMMPKCSIKVFTHPSDSSSTPDLHLMDCMQFDPDSRWPLMEQNMQLQTHNTGPVYTGFTHPNQRTLQPL